VEVNEMISSGLLELYVMGETNAEETQLVQSMAAKHPQIASEIAAIEEAMESYALANAVSPSSNVKEKLFSQLNITKVQDNTAKVLPIQNTPVRTISSAWKTAAAAAVVLFVGSAVFNGIMYNKFNSAKDELAKTQQQLNDAKLANDEMANNMQVVQNKNAEYVKLAGLPASPNAVAKIYWVKNTEDVYVDPSNLPDAPQGMEYQLWAIVDGKPVDGGMINSQKKTSIQKMKSFGRAEAFAITLETKGGNPTPKGEMYVMGKL
jgi:anti-sigma-K factor RskA